MHSSCLVSLQDTFVGTGTPDSCGICAAGSRRAFDGLAATLDHLYQHRDQGLPCHTALTCCKTLPTSGAGKGGRPEG